MKLLLDEHFSAVIGDALRTRGHDVIALQDDALRHLRGSSDDDVFETAQQMERVLVTENVAHFREIADRCYRTGRHHAGLLYTGNTNFPRHRHDQFVSAIVAALDAWLQSTPTAPITETFLPRT